MGPRGEVEEKDIVAGVLNFSAAMLQAGFEVPTVMHFPPRAAAYLRYLARSGGNVSHDFQASQVDRGYCCTIGGIVCREDRGGR